MTTVIREFIPRYYEVEAVAALFHNLEINKKALLDMGSGLGKTHTSALLCKKLFQAYGPLRVLFLVHDSDILKDAKRMYQEIFGESATYGFFYGSEKNMEESTFTFASFQTMKEWKHAFYPHEFNLVIVDEAHHGWAETYRETIAYFDPEYSLGMTGTKERMDGGDIEEIWGETSYFFPLERGIAEEFLSNVHYHMTSVHLNRKALNKFMKQDVPDRKLSMKLLNEVFYVRQMDEAIADDIRKHMEDRQTMIFCESIEHAERMQAYFPEGRTYHSGNKKYKASDPTTMEQFKRNEFQVLLVRDKGMEGVDTKDVEFIAFVRCTDSRRVFLQQLARGLRKSAKTLLIHDYVGNVDRLMMVRDFADGVRPYLKNICLLDRRSVYLDHPSITVEIDREYVDIEAQLRKLRTYISDIPELLAQFHPIKNGNLNPENIIAGSPQKFWWKCENNPLHEWQAAGSSRMKYIQNRTRGNGCPICANRSVGNINSMATTHPELALEFDREKNFPITPEDIIASTHLFLWWKCANNAVHVWQTTGNMRVHQKTQCPFCKNQKVDATNCMRITHPHLVEEFHVTLNTPYTPDTVLGTTNKKLWWFCLKNPIHIWQATSSSRVKGSGCPYCKNKKVDATNCLRTTHPHLIEEFHEEMNAPLTPDTVLATTNKKLWWSCVKDKTHIWSAKGYLRVQGERNCPHCKKERQKNTKKSV